MRNNKGQALIEFILVLPIFLLIIISMIDFGNITLKKYSLENDLDTISTMYLNNEDYESYASNKGIQVNYVIDQDYTTITLTKKVRILCPILMPILGTEHEIKVEKSVIND